MPPSVAFAQPSLKSPATPLPSASAGASAGAGDGLAFAAQLTNAAASPKEGRAAEPRMTNPDAPAIGETSEDGGRGDGKTTGPADRAVEPIVSAPADAPSQAVPMPATATEGVDAIATGRDEGPSPLRAATGDGVKIRAAPAGHRTRFPGGPAVARDTTPPSSLADAANGVPSVVPSGPGVVPPAAIPLPDRTGGDLAEHEAAPMPMGQSDAPDASGRQHDPAIELPRAAPQEPDRLSSFQHPAQAAIDSSSAPSVELAMTSTGDVTASLAIVSSPAAAPRPSGGVATYAAAAPPVTAQSASPIAQAAPALVSLVARHGMQSLDLRLSPDELGMVHIRLEQTSGEPPRISLTADRAETLDVLVRDQAQLHRALDDAGVASAGRTLSFHLAPPAHPEPSAAPAADSTGSPNPSPSHSGSPGENGAAGDEPRTGSGRRAGVPRATATGDPVGDVSAADPIAAAPRRLRAGIDITA